MLINHYTESEDLVKRQLKSIEAQTFQDYSVMICSDGMDNKLDRDFLSGFPFDIQYFAHPHCGVCATRNALLDRASADYVMFCDADDSFSSPDGLSVLLDAAEKQRADVVDSGFDEEIKSAYGFRYRRVPNNAIWVHGKIFRLDYLRESNIRFPDEMVISGDMYFLWQALNLSEKIVQLHESFYTWHWNANSVTRKKPFHKVFTYDKFLRTYTLLAENLVNRKRQDLCDKLVVAVISAVYADGQSLQWRLVPPEFRTKAEEAVSRFIARYGALYMKVPEKFRYEQYCAAMAWRGLRDISRDKFNGLESWLDSVARS